MPRTARIAPGGGIYHVLNRGVGNMTLFRGKRDHEVFQRCLLEAIEKVPVRVLGYCVMSNHWHLVLWPAEDGELAKFMLRLTISHARRWLIHRGEVGMGHVYQGRYKSFAVQDDDHVATVCRYIERNPLRAGLVNSCVDWPWSSAGQSKVSASLRIAMTDLPVSRRRDWVRWVDRPQTAAEEAALARCVKEGRPYGSESWIEKMKKAHGWRDPLKRGRPWPNREKGGK